MNLKQEYTSCEVAKFELNTKVMKEILEKEYKFLFDKNNDEEEENNDLKNGVKTSHQSVDMIELYGKQFLSKKKKQTY